MPEPALDDIRSLRDLRRAQIVKAARSLVAAEGLEALTFGALEKRLSFTRGVITYHFRNKDEIVRAVLEDAVADIEHGAVAAVRAADDPAQAVQAVIEAMVGGFLGHADAPQVLVSYWSRLRSDPELAELNAGLYRRWRAFSAELVRRGVEAGRFRADADPETAGVLVVGAVIGIATQSLFEPGAVDVGRAAEQAAADIVAGLTG